MSGVHFKGFDSISAAKDYLKDSDLTLLLTVKTGTAMVGEGKYQRSSWLQVQCFY